MFCEPHDDVANNAFLTAYTAACETTGCGKKVAP